MPLKCRDKSWPLENAPFGADWVAVDAVLPEPSSAQNSLLTGKITGKFWKSSLGPDFSDESAATIQWVAAKFPTRRNTEIKLDIGELACRHHGTNSQKCQRGGAYSSRNGQDSIIFTAGYSFRNGQELKRAPESILLDSSVPGMDTEKCMLIKINDTSPHRRSTLAKLSGTGHNSAGK
jgi:hypothetical protein